MPPGPSALDLVVGLLVFAVAVTVVGEAVRAVASRWVRIWRDLEALERLLLDLFLGGAVYYLVAVLPFGLFTPPVLVGVGGLAGAGVVARAWVRQRTVTLRTVTAWLRPFLEAPALLTLLSALALLLFEVALATPVGTGNTYDSSLLTLYTARLLSAHQLPLSFLPYANVGILYPQGTTAWLGSAQLFLGLPGARTSLLVAPLFFALAPVGGYVLGRRLFGSGRAGAAFALTLAFLASWTRVLVGGSNDFVTAFPLVLLLAGEVSTWSRSAPTMPDAIGVGVVIGYSAALNPVGAEWLFPVVLIAALVTVPRFAGAGVRWLFGWTASLASALVVLAPTWYVLAHGIHSPGFVPGSGAVPGETTGGISGPQFVGLVDPYLFRPDNIWLSPVPALRLELALLLTLGVGVLVLVYRSPVARYLSTFRTYFLSSVAVLFGLLGVELAASTGWGPAVALSHLTSAAELSIWLFAWYGFAAAVPLVLALEWFAIRMRVPPEAPAPPGPSRRRPGSRGGHRAAALGPAAVALLIVLPAGAFTATQLASPMNTLYSDFGNVTADDFAMLAYLGSHLPVGARLLVAPGSAAEFVPAYAPDIVLLYPMVPGWTGVNASYSLLVRELTNGTLDAAGLSALRALSVGYIAVTGRSTTLWPPFEPAPLLNDSAEFPRLFTQGSAYVFGVA
jgi:hypothetical protein